MGIWKTITGYINPPFDLGHTLKGFHTDHTVCHLTVSRELTRVNKLSWRERRPRSAKNVFTRNDSQDNKTKYFSSAQFW